MHTRFIGISLTIVAFATSSAVAQQDGVAEKGFAYEGIEKCAICHEKPSAIFKTDFVPLTEFAQWAKRDKHSRTYLRIVPDKELYESVHERHMELQGRLGGAPIEESWSGSNELSAQICRKLGIAPTAFKDAREKDAQQCLSCHANWREQDKEPDPAVFKWGIGVGCESCHGAASEWAKPANHQMPIWRKLDPQTKWSDFGMIDVRNPIKRAEQCFGCHIGNAAEGKIITHEMYTAGHPPLPSIEIESFAQQMPRHWRYLGEKIADAKPAPAGNDPAADPFVHFEEFVRENHKYFNLASGSISEQVAGHKHRPAAVILGGAIALREHIELLRELARAEEPAKYSWPELATFDCRACHHELEVPSRRQEQRAGSIPGRPTIPQWPSVLVPLAISHAYAPTSDAEKHDEFRTKMAALQAEFERTPFGSPTLHDTCTDLLDWLEKSLIPQALKRPFGGRAVTDSFILLADIASKETHDFDSARQIAWALRILSCGISNDSLREAIQGTLGNLTTELQLNLPNGPAEQCAPASTIDESRRPIPLGIDLSDSLAAPAQYDAAQFRTQMQKLRALLPAEK